MVVKLNFKVGDVVTVSRTDCCGGDFPLGTVGIVDRVMEGRAGKNYKVCARGDYWFYCDDCLSRGGTIEETIMVSKELLCSLKKDADFLSCLQACGVDNWDGYTAAHELYDTDF